VTYNYIIFVYLTTGGYICVCDHLNVCNSAQHSKMCMPSGCVLYRRKTRFIGRSTQFINPKLPLWIIIPQWKLNGKQVETGVSARFPSRFELTATVFYAVEIFMFLSYILFYSHFHQQLLSLFSPSLIRRRCVAVNINYKTT